MWGFLDLEIASRYVLVVVQLPSLTLQPRGLQHARPPYPCALAKLRQGKYKMSLEYLVPDSKEVLKKVDGY